MSDTPSEKVCNTQAYKHKHLLLVIIGGMVLLIIAATISYPVFIIHSMFNRTDTVSMMLPVQKGTNRYDFYLQKDIYAMNFMFSSLGTEDAAVIKGNYRVISEGRVLAENTYDRALDADGVKHMKEGNAVFVEETKKGAGSMSSPPYPWTHIYEDYVPFTSLRMVSFHLEKYSQVTIILDIEDIEGDVYLHVETYIDSL